MRAMRERDEVKLEMVASEVRDSVMIREGQG